jgi:hypothetical protein
VLALQTAARPVWTFLGADPGHVSIEWDTDSTHQFESYHWAAMYDALLALPLGGMRGFRDWAENEGLATPQISDTALKALRVTDTAGRTFSAAEVYLHGGMPGPDQDFRIRLAPGNGAAPRLSIPHRRDALGLPGRDSRWRGVRQRIETSESLNGPWTPLTDTDLTPLNVEPGPTPASERLWLEDQRPDPPSPVFYRVRLIID